MFIQNLDSLVPCFSTCILVLNVVTGECPLHWLFCITKSKYVLNKFFSSNETKLRIKKILKITFLHYFYLNFYSLNLMTHWKTYLLLVSKTISPATLCSYFLFYFTALLDVPRKAKISLMITNTMIFFLLWINKITLDGSRSSEFPSHIMYPLLLVSRYLISSRFSTLQSTNYTKMFNYLHTSKLNDKT